MECLVTVLMSSRVIALSCIIYIFVKYPRVSFCIYRKILNISPGLIEVRKHFLSGLYSGGAYIQGGLYSEGILC